MRAVILLRSIENCYIIANYKGKLLPHILILACQMLGRALKQLPTNCSQTRVHTVVIKAFS